jgi:hypothetical protein
MAANHKCVDDPKAEAPSDEPALSLTAPAATVLLFLIATLAVGFVIYKIHRKSGSTASAPGNAKGGKDEESVVGLQRQ